MSKIERILFLLLGIIIWMYLGIRAAHVPLIHDEVVTYIAYIRDATFIPPWSYWDANNHLLNSAISAFLTNLFGSSPFAIRMASWLTFGIFLFFIFKIANQIRSLQKRWFLILPLLTAAFFIEFYGLTRGYGMSMSFLLGTLFFAFDYAQSPSNKKGYLISLFGILAALGSLSLIVSVGIIYGWVLLWQLKLSNQAIFKTVLAWFTLFIVPLLPLVYYVLLLKEKGLLYYGGDSFIDFTLKPMARLFFESASLWWIWIAAFSFITGVYVLGIIRNGISTYFKPNHLFAFVLYMSVIAIFVQHFLLGVNYPEDRAALYLIPLLVLTLVFLPLSDKRIYPNFILVMALWFPINLGLTANTSFSKLWKFEYVPTRFIEKVNEGSQNDYPPTVNGYFLRAYIWDYAQLNLRSYPSTINGDSHPDEWADFMLVDSNRIKTVSLTRFDVLDYDAISGQSLLKQKIPNTEIFKRDTLLTNVKVENEYTNIFEFNPQNWLNKPMAMYFNMDVKASDEIMHTLIISSVFDTNGVELRTNKYSFSQVSEDWTDKKGWKVKLYLPPFPQSAGRFVTYIYNPRKEHHLFPKIECKLAEISIGKLNSKQSLNP